ncbi:TIGR03016 family PEP-CTERM system-associated outer membrane protein [Glaciecola sp. MH2013]|nr:TIGR03016 family PEP-CTERM system-associated outer membrane protein [Glaciecola sp. MH2013]
MFMLALIVSAGLAQAQELKYTLSVDAENVFQDIYSEDDRQTLNTTNFIIRPRLNLSYRNKRASLTWGATHNHVRRGLEDLDVTNNYTNYNYRGSYDLVENLLQFTANGALNYQNVGASGFLVDDFLTNAQNLSKTRSNRYGLNLNLPRGDYFGHQTQIAYSNTESERNINSFAQLNSKVYNINTNTFSGNNFERFRFGVQTGFTISERPDNGDFASRQVDAELAYQIYNGFGALVSTSHEANQVSSSETSFSRLQDFNSIGAGIIWQAADNRSISLTWNRADSDAIEEDEDNKGYVGLDINWRFTPRTSLAAEYERRFFGEAGSFSFQHQIRRFRTQIRYSEEVTSFARLISNPDNLGVFVCTDGVSELAACFQPNSLNYQLAPNEQFVQFSEQDTEINDEIILRKALSWQLGVQQRRTRISINGRYATNDFLETNRLSRTYSAGSLLSFQIGRRTNFSWTLNAAYTDESIDGESGSSDVYSSKLSISRDLGRYFKLALDFSYLDREVEGRVLSSGTGAAGINGSLQDRRVALNLSYRLAN